MVLLAKHFYLFSGGPGSGKSSLLDYLSHQGYHCMAEAGRQIIQQQVSIAGPALPWQDRQLFAEMMLSWELRNYHAAQRADSPLVLFDRGIPDIIGYLRLEGLQVPAHLMSAARQFRYHPLVFMAPPRADIYHQDTERRQDFNTACQTFDAIAKTYEELGYDLIELPKTSIEQRAAFVCAHLETGR
ncbi:AAA family ATPase [Methylophilus sp.]|jgi:predicted ATPase|uniref:AAA family ATPase n=1 Tax=Methylophilus sp. TaxID=29541 RepID=UPI000D4B390A|nr:AAA family ATPase [Methylophilus sp.]PPD11786.1 MAG: ATPase [Methylophilus sp.]